MNSKAHRHFRVNWSIPRSRWRRYLICALSILLLALATNSDLVASFILRLFKRYVGPKTMEMLRTYNIFLLTIVSNLWMLLFYSAINYLGYFTSTEAQLATYFYSLAFLLITLVAVPILSLSSLPSDTFNSSQVKEAHWHCIFVTDNGGHRKQKKNLSAGPQDK